MRCCWELVKPLGVGQSTDFFLAVQRHPPTHPHFPAIVLAGHGSYHLSHGSRALTLDLDQCMHICHLLLLTVKYLLRCHLFP